MASAATLTSDKPDYAPGETAILTGAGFWANEWVWIDIDLLDPVTLEVIWPNYDWQAGPEPRERLLREGETLQALRRSDFPQATPEFICFVVDDLPATVRRFAAPTGSSSRGPTACKSAPDTAEIESTIRTVVNRFVMFVSPRFIRVRTVAR